MTMTKPSMISHSNLQDLTITLETLIALENKPTIMKLVPEQALAVDEALLLAKEGQDKTLEPKALLILMDALEEAQTARTILTSGSQTYAWFEISRAAIRSALVFQSKYAVQSLAGQKTSSRKTASGKANVAKARAAKAAKAQA